MNYKKLFANVVSGCVPFRSTRRAVREHLFHALGQSVRSTFSQHGQDILARAMFDALGVDKPTYLDLGAHHPNEISNTALFYRSGCRGINVEPDPALIGAFRRRRPGDVNLCVGCGAEPGTLPYYVIFTGCDGNGFDREKIEKMLATEAQGLSITKVKMVPVVTLAGIIEDHAGGVFPDLLDMDLEGMEYDVLRSFDLSANGPKIAIIEGAGNHALRELMLGYGYFEYAKMGADFIFARNEYRETLY